ncbi:MAG: hypothetical protein K0Q97_425 [Bacillota bacterium]|jgi:putative selenate reductase|nr:hypothetical protein [Bacillota bacterium]
MSETMKTLSFEKIIEICLQDYYTKGRIFDIDQKDFYRDIDDNFKMDFCNEKLRYPLGPAAGPHTQLSQNILTAYLTGSRFFELKTVQIIDGIEMQKMIERPCIDARNEGYNVEWSTELTVDVARCEYTKASVLLQVMAIELGLSLEKDFMFNISVGYNLEGIQSKKISDFIDNLKEANNTEIFKECIEILKRNINKFRKFKLEDINKISSNITNTVTLSTMHGAKAEEIYDIAAHLIVNKKINTFVKCNPTLLGYENVREILDNLGYNEIVLRKDDFEHDLKFGMAKEIITKLINLGKENGVTVGIKLTNTLPVYNSKNVLPGESMYMSGKPLYPIAIGVAAKFAEEFNGDIHISFSGGIDKNNYISVLKTGIAPITISTLFLKPRGYLNTVGILKELKKENFTYDKLNVEALNQLALQAKTDVNYKNKEVRKLQEDNLPTFDCFEKNCGLCVDVCPNRANIRVYDDNFKSAYQILHMEDRCNECGNCHTFCTRGGFPYFKKVTVYPDINEFKSSKNAGVVKIEENKFLLRDLSSKEYEFEANKDKSQNEFETFVETVIKDYPYLF